MSNFQLELNILIKKLNAIERKSEGILDKTYHSISLCRNVLCSFKKQIFSNGFKSLKHEIEFFKNTKQIPLIKLIYFSEIYSFEIQFPKANMSSQKKFIKKKINKINRFFLYNMDFVRYVDSNAKEFDREYYTREYLDTFHLTTSKFYFQDPDFCTPRDMLLGKYRAYLQLLLYLKNKKLELHTTLEENKQIHISSSKLHWAFNNTDYVELLYALYARGLGRKDNLSIMKVSKKLQEVFDFTPKDIYKTYQEIKNRKNSKTLFLDELTTSLSSEIYKSEE